MADITGSVAGASGMLPTKTYTGGTETGAAPNGVPANGGVKIDARDLPSHGVSARHVFQGQGGGSGNAPAGNHGDPNPADGIGGDMYKSL